MRSNINRALRQKNHHRRKAVFVLIPLLLIASGVVFLLTRPNTADAPTPQSQPSLHVKIESIIEETPAYIAVHYPKTDDTIIDGAITDYISNEVAEFKKGMTDSPHSSELYIKFITTYDDSNINFEFDVYANHPSLAHGISDTKTLSFDRTNYTKITIDTYEPPTIAPEDPTKTPPTTDEDFTGKKLVALTFDDGPHPTFTPKLLDTLKRENVKATFFVLGSRVQYYPDVLIRAYNEGHAIGNHTNNHRNLTNLQASDIHAEIFDSSSTIKKTIGQKPFAMRPPYGALNNDVKSAVDTPIILWSNDTEDWKSRNTSAIVTHIKNTVKDGDIVLMHDIYGTTADAAEQIIPWLKENGFALVTVPQMAEIRGVYMEASKVYSSLRP